MASDFSVILEHPLKEDIISKLVTGTPPKEINQWLRLKYNDKDNKHLIISFKLLKEFSESEYMNYYDKYTKDLAVAKQEDNGLDKKAIASIQNNKTYKERLLDVAQKEIDIKKMIINLVRVTEDRAEQIYDLIQNKPHLLKADYVFLKYLEQLLMMVEKYDKIVLKSPDTIVQHNISVQAVDNYSNAMQESIREILAEMSPELSMQFMDKMHEKLTALNMPIQQASLPQETRLEELKVIAEDFK